MLLQQVSQNCLIIFAASFLRPRAEFQFWGVPTCFSGKMYLGAVKAIMAAGAYMARTPVLPMPCGGGPIYKAINVEKLRKCPGGFATPAFLHGQLYLNRSRVPQTVAFCPMSSDVSQQHKPESLVPDLLVLVPGSGVAACETIKLDDATRSHLSLGKGQQNVGYGQIQSYVPLTHAQKCVSESFDMTGRPG